MYVNTRLFIPREMRFNFCNEETRGMIGVSAMKGLRSQTAFGSFDIIVSKFSFRG